VLRHLGLLFAACLICGAAEPVAATYSTHVPGASQVEARVSHTAGWDVTVTFDAETCEIHCQYRRKERGLHLFLAPVTELQVYTDGAANPLRVIIDPAGVRTPVLVPAEFAAFDLSCVEGKGLASAGWVPACTSGRPAAYAPPIPPAVARDTVDLPLRI
jgi:hypothetical protein